MPQQHQKTEQHTHIKSFKGTQYIFQISTPKELNIAMFKYFPAPQT
jgi:hypothetical protein